MSGYKQYFNYVLRAGPVQAIKDVCQYRELCRDLRYAEEKYQRSLNVMLVRRACMDTEFVDGKDAQLLYAIESDCVFLGAARDGVHCDTECVWRYVNREYARRVAKYKKLVAQQENFWAARLGKTK